MQKTDSFNKFIITVFYAKWKPTYKSKIKKLITTLKRNPFEELYN